MLGEGAYRIDRVPDDGQTMAIRAAVDALFLVHTSRQDRLGVCLPVLIALTIPGLTMDRTAFNKVRYHLHGAVQATRTASVILQEQLFTPYHVAGNPAPPIPDRASVMLPTDAERLACPGQVYQTVVLQPSKEAIKRAAQKVKVNDRQGCFLEPRMILQSVRDAH